MLHYSIFIDIRRRSLDVASYIIIWMVHEKMLSGMCTGNMCYPSCPGSRFICACMLFIQRSLAMGISIPEVQHSWKDPDSGIVTRILHRPSKFRGYILDYQLTMYRPVFAVLMTKDFWKPWPWGVWSPLLHCFSHTLIYPTEWHDLALLGLATIAHPHKYEVEVVAG